MIRLNVQNLIQFYLTNNVFNKLIKFIPNLICPVFFQNKQVKKKILNQSFQM